MVKIAPDKSLPQTKNRGQWLTLTAVELALASYRRRRIGTPATAYLAASSSRQSLAPVVPPSR
jgi:hypothetical protein